jgi:hypothetical protein
MSSERLHQRLRQMKARIAIQKWEARQVNHAGGVWFRLQRLLSDTRRALVISADEAAILLAAGFESHPVGHELQPPKELFVIPEAAVPRNVTGREIALQDGQAILHASAMILIPFE